ncbi:MAG: hypothetical protein AB7V16_13245 [Vulcanibacillus sp.]
MSKGVQIVLIFVYMVLLTFLADSLAVTASTEFIEGVGFVEPTVSILSLLSTFWGLLSFHIDGIPFLITLFAVYPPLLLLFWNFISLIRGV